MSTQPPKRKMALWELIVTFLGPTLVGKAFILYFGIHYSSNPGEGYGIGLAITIAITALLIFRFLWRFRNYEDI